MNFRQHFGVALASAALLAMAAAPAVAASYSYSRSYSSPSYSRSYSSSPSFSRPTYSAPNYTIRSATMKQSYTPAPSAAAKPWSWNTQGRGGQYTPTQPAAPQRNVTINKTYVTHDSGGSGMGFFHGMMLGQMMGYHQPAVVVGGGAPGYVGGPGYVQGGVGWNAPVYAGWSIVEGLIALAILIFIIALMVWVVRRAIRDEERYGDDYD